MKFYLDTSVFGGLFDKEFQHPTQKLFDFIENKGIKIIYSDVLEDELELAPQEIRLVANERLLKAEYIKLDEEMIELAGIYIKEGALTKKSINDARHIAIATISGASAIVSWNFKHMVNFIRIRQYDAINLLQGYGTIRIHTPIEIIE
jgi:predicted nucleic acid-binding protein